MPAAAGAAAVVLAVATLGACTAGGSSSRSPSDGKSAPFTGSTVSPAPPGKYRTLPQPCLSVDLDALKKLVPGAPDYAGTESLTYDTDRRVGCTWRNSSSDGAARTLRIDIDRVVSYDPSISDEVQAELDFERAAAAIPIVLSPTDGGTPGTPAGTAKGPGASSAPGATDAPPGPTEPGGADGPDGSGQDLAPRALMDVGNAAFINDVPRPGPGSPGREVTVVFRTANVLVNIRYSVTAAPHGAPPDSADLQQGAREVADQLERRIEG